MSKNISVFSIGLYSVCGLFLLAILAFDPIGSEPQGDVWKFWGRFHPVVLHLPVALLILLALMEALVLSRIKPELKEATHFVLNLTVLSAPLAVATGVMLAYGEGSNEELVRDHMRNGIFLALACVVLGFLKQFDWTKGARVGYGATMVVAICLLGVASHDGGSITHGRDYLTKYMPNGMRPFFGLAVEEKELIASADELRVFEHVIQPMVEQNCLSCHNPDKLKGELNLETYEGHLAGGEIGPAIVPGDLDESEFYFRITLPRDDEEFMPPDEKPPLSEAEVALVAWWIENGAPKDAKVGEISGPPSEVERYIATVFSQMLSAEDLERLQKEREELYADLSALKAETGLVIEPSGPDSTEFFLHAHSISKSFENEALNSLVPYAAHFVKADLSGTLLDDGAFDSLSKFENLRTLNLSKTSLSGDGIDKLATLENLEVLNLYGTDVGENRLEDLAKLTQLKKLYLFQTELHTDALLEQLRARLPNCEVM
ncbi:MAG: c-type cytochrome domain-containing protein [Verrucomicrobiota bacterium]